MNFRWRVIWVTATVLLFGYYAVANYASEETRIESPWVPDNALRLGLDLRGGIHWVIGVKLGATEDHELGFLKGLLEDELERTEIEQRRYTEYKEFTLESSNLARIPIPPLLAIVFVLLSLEILLSNTRLRTIP